MQLNPIDRAIFEIKFAIPREILAEVFKPHTFFFFPASEQWEKATKLPISERVNILEFIAISANRDQASSCYYEITEDYITYDHR